MKVDEILKKLKSLFLYEDIERLMVNFILNAKEKLEDPKIYIFRTYSGGPWIGGGDVNVLVVSKSFIGHVMGERIKMVRDLMGKDAMFYNIRILTYTPREFEMLMRRSIVLQELSERWVEF